MADEPTTLADDEILTVPRDDTASPRAVADADGGDSGDDGDDGDASDSDSTDSDSDDTDA